MRTKLFFAVIAAALSAAACSHPTSPSNTGVYDPSKPISANNRPPCVIDGQPCIGDPRASVVSLQVFVGDCTSNPSACDAMPEMRPTSDPALVVGGNDTYIVPTHYTQETLRFCVDSPRVTGRSIWLTLSLSPAPGIQMRFQEQDQGSRVCLALAVDMLVSGGVLNIKSNGQASFSEFGQDVLSTSPEFRKFALRVRGM